MVKRVTVTSDSKPSVLIVDDNSTVLRLVSRMMAALGWDSLTALNGDSALEQLENHSIRLVITDLQMPGIDGWELALLIKSMDPAPPVIAMTGQCESAILPQLQASALDQVLFKPFTLEALKQVVRSATTRSQGPERTGPPGAQV